MSTKIYNALRVKDPDPIKIWDLMKELRATAERNVVDRLRRYYRTSIIEMDPTCEACQKVREPAWAKDLDEVAVRMIVAHDQIVQGFKKSTGTQIRDFFDPEVSFTLMRHPTQGFFMRYFCDRGSVLGGSLDFMLEHPALEDYHYQDQADRPDEISEEAWEERKRVWTELTDPAGYFVDQMIIEVSNWTSYFRIDPYLDMRRKLRDENFELPSREAVLAARLARMEAFEKATGSADGIDAVRVDGVSVSIRRARKRSSKKQWIVLIGDKAKVQPTLERAFNWVETQHLSPSMKKWISRILRDQREKKKSQKKARKTKAVA